MSWTSELKVPQVEPQLRSFFFGRQEPKSRTILNPVCEGKRQKGIGFIFVRVLITEPCLFELKPSGELQYVSAPRLRWSNFGVCIVEWHLINPLQNCCCSRWCECAMKHTTRGVKCSSLHQQEKKRGPSTT